MTDQEFAAAIETCRLPNAQFHHRDHLRLAWIYLRRYGPELGEAQRLCLDSQVCGVSRQS